jgi:2-octaprenyl-6-methoxyphenol hydroxylase
VNARAYDVVVAGGGMVGASLACALAELPLSVAVVEPFPFSSAAQPSFDLRTTALSRSSQRILSSLGVWAEVAGFAAPIRRIHISEQGRFGSAVIDAAEQGVDSLGYVLENRRLGQVLWDRLSAADNIQLISPGEILAARPGAESSELDLRMGDGEQTIQARLLVVADGARSRLREALGVACQQRP